MRDRLYQTEAIILRRSDVGEADRLLTIFTPSYGKLKVSARGVRKTSSKLAGHLELFVHTRLHLARGRTFDVVTDSRVLHTFQTMRADLERIGWTAYVAELLDRMTVENNENAALFRLFRDVLTAIDETDDPLRREVVIRFYELHLLTLSGYRPHLFHCAQCEAELDQRTERYNPYAGGALCPRCAPTHPLAVPLPLPVFKLLRFLARGTIADALTLNVSAALLNDAAMLLKVTYRQFLERDLKSVVFLDHVRG